MAKLFRVAITGTVVGEPFANVIYVEAPSQTAQQVTDAIDTGFIDVIKPHLANTTTYGSITATEVGHLLLDPDYFQKAIAKTGGQLDAATTDPQLALCFRLHTGLAGRKRRGRFFLAGVPDIGVENGRLAASWPGYMTTVANDLEASLTGATPTSGVKLVVFSRKIFDGLTDIILDSYKPVTSISHATVMSTMRSRKPAA